MKTKAYKVRERIARYIYKRLYPYNPSVIVLFNSEERKWKLYDKEEWGSLEYINERDEVEKVLGIDLYFTLNRTGTVMWNKEKEERYAKMCQEKAKEKKYPGITTVTTVYLPVHYKTWIPTVYPPVHSQIWHNESKKHFALWKGR